nr:endonuclease MutS2 [Tissierella sp.]
MNTKTIKALEYKKIIHSLMEKCQSSLGKKRAEEVKPLTDMAEITKLQGETDEALTLLLKRGAPPLYGISGIKADVKRAEMGGTLNPGALLRIGDSLRVSRDLKNFLKEVQEDKDKTYPLIQGYIEDLSVFKDIENEITNAIISEQEISDNASTTLRSIRRQIVSKNDSVRDKLNSIVNSQENKKYLQDNIVTMREGRYVVPVKAENKNNIKGLVHDMSGSGATLFIEPIAVVELNNELRELELKEREEIEKILKALSALVAGQAEPIANNQFLLQELDFIFAKGKLALDMNATKPILNDRGRINIKKGRHPLLNVKDIVPIDIYLGKDFDSLIITGPNTGGKTVSLKTVGLLVMMAQSGLHIPADFNSEIGVFDQIFADIGDEQSIEQSLSTFSSHMVNIVDILANVERNSLVLFDELGAGTDPTEGAALAMSILDYLLGMGVKTIATTHYSQLKLYALTTEGVVNGSVEFDVQTLSPTYKLLIGVPGKSNAFEISQRLGLEMHIIDYARGLISEENIEFEDVLESMEKDRIMINQNKEEAEKYRLQVENLKGELSHERDRTREMREKILQDAKEEARSILRRAKDDSDYIVKELREVSIEIEKEKLKRIQEAQEELKGKLKKAESQVSDRVLNVKSKKPPKELKAGETVEVLTLNQTGTVLEKPDDNGNVKIQVGIMKISAHISSLRRSESRDTKKIAHSTKKIMSSKTKDVRAEIDLRGHNQEEAFMELDKYLDDAYLAGLKEVQIIHGKGTGVLRQGVKGYLKKNRHVKASRLGSLNEGGDGVTIAELK